MYDWRESRKPKQEAVVTSQQWTGDLLGGFFAAVFAFFLALVCSDSWGISLGVFFIVLLCFIWWTWKRHGIAREFENDGQVTHGVIINRWMETRGAGPGGTITDYYVAYQYQPPDGDFLGVRQRIGSKIYEGLQVGDPVTVCYLPRDPKYSRIVEWR